MTNELTAPVINELSAPVTDDFPIPTGDGETKAEMVLWGSDPATFAEAPGSMWDEWFVRFLTFEAWMIYVADCVRSGHLLHMPDPKKTTLAESLVYARNCGCIGVRIRDERGNIIAEFPLPKEDDQK